MKKIVSIVVLAAIAVSCNKTGGANTQVTDKLQNNDQKAGYAYGMNIGDQVRSYSLQQGPDKGLDFKELEKGVMDYLKNSSKNRDSYATGQNIGMSVSNFIKNNELEGIVDEKYIVQGLMDVLNGGKTLFPGDSINTFLTGYMQNVGEKVKAKSAEESAKFLSEKKKDKKIKSTESGLLYEVIKEGDGAVPGEGAVVEVNYVGKHRDGTTFDESPKDEPVKFSLNGVIKGWQEGLMLMKVGSKYRFYIPSDLAYGEFGTPDGKIKGNEALIFDVELISAQEAPKADTSGLPQIPTPGN